MMTDNLNRVIANLTKADSQIHFLANKQLTSIDYQDLRSLVLGNAKYFSSLGITKDTKVLISLSTNLEHIITFLALVALGALPVSVKPAKIDSSDYNLYIANISNRFAIDWLYDGLPMLPDLDSFKWRADAKSRDLAIIAEVESDDLVFVQFSSGSTSSPKAIPISHRNLMANLSAILAVDKRSSSSVGFNFLPLSHDMGLVAGFLSNLIYQNTLLLAKPTEFLRQPVNSLIIANDLNAEVTAMPDFALKYLHKSLSMPTSRKLPPNLLANFKTIYCGAEPISEITVTSFLHTAQKFSLTPNALFFSYGLAEATLMVTGRRFDTIANSFYVHSPHQITACLGLPLGGAEVRISQVNTKEGEKETGIIQIRSPSLFAGYWQDSPRRQLHDWFDTGDYGLIRDGNLYVCGRAKDTIIVNGENIFAVDIENSLASLPEIKNSLVMIEEDKFYILAISSGGYELKPQGIRTFVCNNFGVAPQAVISGSSN